MSVIKINKTNYDEIVGADRPVLMDFYADWCGPCRMVAPIVESIASENPQYIIGKVNVDEEPELARKFGIISIPTLVVMKNGNLVNKATGMRPKEQILSLLEG